MSSHWLSLQKTEIWKWEWNWIQTIEEENRGAFPYLQVVGNFHMIDPLFWHFLKPMGHFLCPPWSVLTPFFCRRHQFVSITFSSWDNLAYSWSNFSPKSVIWTFWSILYQFCHWFWILLTPFFIVLRYVWLLIFTKLYIWMGPFLIACLPPPPPKIWWSVNIVIAF